MKLLFDIEANGLEPTIIWCMSVMDINTLKVNHYGPDDLVSGFAYLAQADTLIGHNIISYDLHWIKKLYGHDFYDKELIDTLVWSRMFNPDREGGHGLGPWGFRLGYSKVEHEDWTAYSEEMEHRCTEDVHLNFKVYQQLCKEKTNFSSESILLEHQVAKIIHKQSVDGWTFDIPKATILQANIADELGELEDKVRETFKPKQVLVKEVTPKLRKDGVLSKMGLREEEYAKLVNISPSKLKPFKRYDTVEFNLGSRQMIGRWLQEDFGWKPTKFTPTGQAEINEKVLETVTGIPEVELIHRYLLIQKIYAFLNRWLDSVGDDGKQHGYVNTIGAITRRMTHSNPNLAQVPSSRKPYGGECRSLFTARKGFKLVGMDADALELRMLAHYMNNPNYIEAVHNGNKDLGTDAHSVNMRAAGLSDRDQAKTLFYALIYGAGDFKIGQIVGAGRKAGKELKFRLFQSLPDLGDLIAKVEAAGERGFIKAIDGSILICRSPRAALNVLLQGGGSIVMKRTLYILDTKLKDHNIESYFVGNCHDEIQADVREDQVQHYKTLALDAIIEAGEFYKMRIPMIGDVAIGNNWNETH